MTDQSGAVRVIERTRAVQWAYNVGLPRYQAEAFGDWYVEKYPDTRFAPAYSTAKLAWDYDERAREIVRAHGSRPEGSSYGQGPPQEAAEGAADPGA